MRPVCANCRMWCPEDPEDREPWINAEGKPEFPDIHAPCGVRPPTEWLYEKGFINVERPRTYAGAWCRFWERYEKAEPSGGNEVSECNSDDTSEEPVADDDLLERVAKMIHASWSLRANPEYEDYDSACAAIQVVADTIDREFEDDSYNYTSEEVSAWLRSQLED